MRDGPDKQQQNAVEKSRAGRALVQRTPAEQRAALSAFYAKERQQQQQTGTQRS